MPRGIYEYEYKVEYENNTETMSCTVNNCDFSGPLFFRAAQSRALANVDACKEYIRNKLAWDKGLALDSSRTEFVNEFAATVSKLMRGELVGNNRYRRLLLGAKGQGKSALLTSFHEALQAFQPELISIYIDYSAFLRSAHDLPLPSRILELSLEEHIHRHNLGPIHYATQSGYDPLSHVCLCFLFLPFSHPLSQKHPTPTPTTTYYSMWWGWGAVQMGMVELS